MVNQAEESLGNKKLKEYEERIRKYFVCCPECGLNRLIFDFEVGAPNPLVTLTCDDCGAVWMVAIGRSGRLEWARLRRKAWEGEDLLHSERNREMDEVLVLARQARQKLYKTIKEKSRPQT